MSTEQYNWVGLLVLERSGVYEGRRVRKAKEGREASKQARDEEGWQRMK